MQLQLNSIVFLIFATVQYGNSENSATIITIPQGTLQGKELVSRDGKVFYGFMGIPFAQPPDRFQPAKGPAPTWEGIYNATNYKPKCLQLNFTTGQVEGQEDCLFINVFTPDPSAPANLTVLPFIHGGGFQFGLAYENGPEFILDHPVVFVTFTYRLASLGFLTTEDDVMPGNNGMKDQVLALRWIQENIQYFGGSPEKVTLFGESAGAASVGLHVLSPLSEGLFQKAILQSGSAIERWPVIESPRETTVALAEMLNCPTTSSQAILECLQGKPAEDIVGINMRKSLIETMIKFGPVLEKVNTTDNPAFIQIPPIEHYNQLKFAKVPLIITFNNVEGLVVNALMVLASPEMTTAFNDDWENTVAQVFSFDKPSYSAESRAWAAHQLRQFYFADRPVSRDTLGNLTNMYTDGTFAQRSRRTALIHGNHAPVYTAILAFKGIWSQTFGMGFTEMWGMSHADDLSYLFTDYRYPPFPVGSPSEQFSKVLVKLWVNFAVTGNPGFTLNDRRWEPVSDQEIQNDRLDWLVLKNTPEFMQEPILERMLLWDQIDTVLATGIIPSETSSKNEL